MTSSNTPIISQIQGPETLRLVQRILDKEDMLNEQKKRTLAETENLKKQRLDLEEGRTGLASKLQDIEAEKRRLADREEMLSELGKRNTDESERLVNERKLFTKERLGFEEHLKKQRLELEVARSNLTSQLQDVIAEKKRLAEKEEMLDERSKRMTDERKDPRYNPVTDTHEQSKRNKGETTLPGWVTEFNEEIIHNAVREIRVFPPSDEDLKVALQKSLHECGLDRGVDILTLADEHRELLLNAVLRLRRCLRARIERNLGV
ncbi:MAG: hypothetical protein L6R39_004341 [Caloplaca ligustica]|nr:MAG: hypothetical protein L6R39_004341 [Caloplaca ligustica]